MTGRDKGTKTETKKVEELDDEALNDVTGGGVVGQNFEEVRGADGLKQSDEDTWRCRIGAVRFDRRYS